MAKKEATIVGAPAWMTTFSDLMSLLLAFFVLLFSFSELDKAKYKQVAGSMKEAFGVQQAVRVKDPPKGLSVIAREFSPGVPRPTALNEVRQFTTQDSSPFPVVLQARREDPADGEKDAQRRQEESNKLDDKGKLQETLRPEIDAGLVELEVADHRLILRIKEKGVFPSGSDRLERAFLPIIDRLGGTLAATTGKVVVAGHTDSIPIENSLFRSNWELSMARAMRVAHVLFARSPELANRVHLEAYAEHRPVDDNATAEGRARNRRVEISLVYGLDPVGRAHGWILPEAGAPADGAPVFPAVYTPFPAAPAAAAAPAEPPAPAADTARSEQRATR